MFKYVLMAMVVCVSSLLAQAMPAGWTDDFEAAKKQAAEEGKDLLVDFSGSDWCGWCKKLDGEVFTKPEFVEAASQDFVLVQIDMPRDKSRLSEIAKANNPKLISTYNIHAFPSIFLMNAKGDVYAKTGYRPGGVAPYLKNLADLKKANKTFTVLMTAANQLEGVAKAQKLDEALSALTEEVRLGKVALMKDMLAADPKDTVGLKKKYAYYTDFLPLEKTFAQKQREALEPLNEKARGFKRDDPQLKAKIKALQAQAAELMKPVMKEKIQALDILLASTSFDSEHKQAVLLGYVKAYQVLGDQGKMTEAMTNARDAAPLTPVGKSISKALDKMAQAEKKSGTPESK